MCSVLHMRSLYCNYLNGFAITQWAKNRNSKSQGKMAVKLTYYAAIYLAVKFTLFKRANSISTLFLFFLVFGLGLYFSLFYATTGWYLLVHLIPQFSASQSCENFIRMKISLEPHERKEMGYLRTFERTPPNHNSTQTIGTSNLTSYQFVVCLPQQLTWFP